MSVLHNCLLLSICRIGNVFENNEADVVNTARQKGTCFFVRGVKLGAEGWRFRRSRRLADVIAYRAI